MTKNEIVARWVGIETVQYTHYAHGEVTAIVHEGIIDYPLLVYYPDKDYNQLHEAWVKFRDLKFEGVQYFKHSALCFDICVKITHGTITEAFDELVRGIEWCNTLNKKVWKRKLNG